ncbi:hypothetical protein BC835DRAFT_1307525 [Cytidiella melzeri]|nr:hypothetical protein BC835DRAFT_1307525 [Cytidiella melzeri]
MDRTDALSSHSSLPLFKMRKAFTKSRMRATPHCQTDSTSVPSSHPAPPTPVLSRLPASIQNLPVEILLNVLGYVLPPLYEKAVRFRSDPRGLYSELTTDFLDVLRDTQRCLRSATLVCRAWYPVANELLYACPFLNSSSSVLSFSRTLRSCPTLGTFVQEAWVFNEEGRNHSDLMGIKRKTTRRVQADLTTTLRSLTSLDCVIVCNHGLIEGRAFPVDNILIYTLPSDPQSAIPKLSAHGPSTFNVPWTRHAKPNNFIPMQLEHLCIRDIEITPAEVKCAPYLPTLPSVHTLQITMFSHNEIPVVSSGTLPALRNLEVYRDIFDRRPRDQMRVVAVDPACLQKLERLFLVGRAAESLLFKVWADSQLFSELRHLAIGLLRSEEYGFVSEWRLPDHLETLEVVVWHHPEGTEATKESEASLREMGDAEGIMKALHACLHRNRQSRAFKKLVIRATAVLPRKLFSSSIDELQELCGAQGFSFELHEGDIQAWIEGNVSGGSV